MSGGTNNQELTANGWIAVHRSFSKGLLNVDQNSPAKISVADVKLPKSDLVRTTYEYAMKELPEKTFNHSMRVYYYGKFILFPFPLF
jgi:cyanamide hydratase